MNRVKNEKVNFVEFVQYVVEHEKKLELVFQDLDRNKDGLFSLLALLVVFN